MLMSVLTKTRASVIYRTAFIDRLEIQYSDASNVPYRFYKIYIKLHIFRQLFWIQLKSDFEIIFINKSKTQCVILLLLFTILFFKQYPFSIF